MTVSPPARLLLLDIARCPVFMRQANPGTCAPILDEQKEASVRQLPEPWSGGLEHAPILFISSNPSIGEDERYPTADWPDDLIEDFFEHRFDDSGLEPWTDGSFRVLPERGAAYGAPVRFWSDVHTRATELLGPAPRPGRDYCLTEVAHCKSHGENGALEAAPPCATRYLQSVVALSAAPLIVVLGRIARVQVRRVFPLEPGDLAGPITVGPRSRLFDFLPHPNAHTAQKTFSRNFSPDSSPGCGSPPGQHPPT